MSTVPETASAERYPYRHAVAHLKAAVKQDSEYLRQAKARVRAMQRQKHRMAAAEQTSVARSRRLARARLVVYGLIRGRPWNTMETNRPEGDASLKHAITTIWLELTRVAEANGRPIDDAPELLRAWLLK